MAKYILAYQILDHEENGGGIYVKEFGMSQDEMHEEVQRLGDEHKEKFKVIHAGFLSQEFIYESVKYAVKYEPKMI